MINHKLLDNIKILLVGDFFLDEYIYGSINRVSPEASVPILNVKHKTINLGGAGNVYNNLINMGVKVSVLGKVGDDTNAYILKKKLNKKGLLNNFIQIQKKTKTIKKTRILNGKDQLIRIDDEKVQNFKNFSSSLKKKIIKDISKSTLIIISDYGKGFCTKEICKFIIKNAKKNNTRTIVDPRKNYNDYSKYIYSDYITPNLNELRLISPKIKNTDKDVLKCSKIIIRKYKIKNVIATRSEKGISFTNNYKNMNIKTQAKKIFDVSGAGDTVVAVFSVMLGLKKNIAECLDVANKAAGEVISKKGTVPIQKKEFFKLIRKKK